MMQRFLCMALVLTPIAQAFAIDHVSADRATLLRWVQGSFSNQSQVQSGTNALADLALDSAKAPDLLFPVFKQIEVPALGAHVIYLQWPMGSPEGKLQRQRIWVFADNPARNAVMMKFYTLKEPDKWLNAHMESAKVRGMTAADVIPYPPACDLPFRRLADVFVGEIPRGDCKIVSQQTKTSMTINARIVVGKDQVWYNESGTRDDGTVVFQVPASGAYEFQRR